MGVYTSLAAITATAGEKSNCLTNGQDLVGMLATAVEATADLTEILTAISNVIGSGTNKTTIATQLTALA